MTATQILSRMGVPEAYQNATFDTLDTEFNKQGELVKKLKGLCEDQKWIILCGKTPGIGKTHLMVACAGWSWQHDFKVVMEQSGNVVKLGDTIPDFDMKNLYKPNTTKYLMMRRFGIQLQHARWNTDDLLNPLTKCRRIAMDELGRDPDEAQEQVEMVIDEVYNYGGQLLATSGTTKAAFMKRYDGSIMSRILHRGQIIEVSGNDFRRK